MRTIVQSHWLRKGIEAEFVRMHFVVRSLTTTIAAQCNKDRRLNVWRKENKNCERSIQFSMFCHFHSIPIFGAQKKTFDLFIYLVDFDSMLRLFLPLSMNKLKRKLKQNREPNESEQVFMFVDIIAVPLGYPMHLPVPKRGGGNAQRLVESRWWMFSEMKRTLRHERETEREKNDSSAHR